MGICRYFIAFYFVITPLHCYHSESHCLMKPSSYWFSRNAPKVNCVKQLNCSIDDEMIRSPAFTISLESTQITFENESLWVQLLLKNPGELPHADTTYTAFVAFGGEDFCYKFTIPAFFKKYYDLPFLPVHQSSDEKLKILLWVYETRAKGSSQLALLLENQYSLKDFSVNKPIKVNHLAKVLSIKKNYVKLSLAPSCPFAFKAAVHEKSTGEVCSTSGIPLCRAESNLTQEHVYINCLRTRFKADRIYCIQTVLSPVGPCSSTYPQLSTETTYFQMNEKCKYWNATVFFKHFSNNSLSVQFSPFHEYLDCFSCFTVHLFRVGHFKVKVKSKTVFLLNNNGEVIFHNMFKGQIYSPEIEPCGKSSLRRSTSLFSIPDDSYPMWLRENIDILLASMVLLSVAGIAASIQLKRCKKKKDVVTLKHENKKNDVVILENGNPRPKVYLFEGRESGLGDLLRSCFEEVHCELRPFLDDRVGWAQELTAYQCRAMGDPEDSGHRFVFVQAPFDPTTIRGQMFTTALRALLSCHPQRCQEDYCHLFVVCFQREDGIIAQLVPFKRYNENSLVDLCLDLGFPPQQKEALIQRIPLIFS